jgi:hypothetical protein
MAKSKTKIKLNPLERWQKAGELGTAIQNALPPDLMYMSLEQIFGGEHDAAITPEVRAMYELRQQLRANSYGQT